jgi:hypothetical protein
MVTPSVLRGLAERLKEFTVVGTYVLLTARAILTEQAQSRTKHPDPLGRYTPAPRPTHWMLPPRCPRPIYRTLHDLRRIAEWQRIETLWTQYPSGQVPITSTTKGNGA